MRIGIDGFNIALPAGTGVATYGRTLATMLHDAGHRTEGVFGLEAARDPALRETLFFDDLGRDLAIGTPAWRTRRRAVRRAALWPVQHRRAQAVPAGIVDRGMFADRLPPFDRIWTATRLFDIAHRHFALYGRFTRLTIPDPPAIMHWTYPVPVTLAGARNVVTLHDLIPLTLPHTTLDAKASYRRLILASIAAADHVCTVSDASRAAILALPGSDPARVTNCYQASAMPEGVLTAPFAEEAARVENILGLGARSYFLYFGAIEPKKNVGRLIEAHLSLGSATPLVIVGGRGWRSEAETLLLDQESAGQEAHAAALAARVIRLDHLPRRLLLALIRCARAVAFPSIAEGFGLPVLEAMQLGTPVLTAAVSATAEVAGDAALLVDPYDVGAIAAGLRALDGDAALRERLAAAGRVRAEHFSMARYRMRIEAMYAGLGPW